MSVCSSHRLVWRTAPLILALASCGGSPGEAATEAYEASIAALRDGRLSFYVERAASKVQLEQMKASWEQQRRTPMAAAEAAQFEEVMASLTAKGAAGKLFETLAPQLALFEQQLIENAGVLPMIVGGLGGQQAAPAVEALLALTDRLPMLGLSDEKKLKKALAVVTDAARELDIDKAAELTALDFDELLEKADVLYAGVVELLDVYGLSLDKSLASTEVTVQSESENQAVLQVSFELFGGPRQAMTLEMARIDGRWVPTGR